MYILMQLAVSSLLRVVWEISDFFTMHARAPIPVYILGRFYSYTNIHYTPTLQNILYTTYIAALASAASAERGPGARGKVCFGAVSKSRNERKRLALL